MATPGNGAGPSGGNDVYLWHYKIVWRRSHSRLEHDWRKWIERKFIMFLSFGCIHKRLTTHDMQTLNIGLPAGIVAAGAGCRVVMVRGNLG